jgi:hypothetical protein
LKQREPIRSGAHLPCLGLAIAERKTMKRRFDELSKTEQEQAELAYHQMEPEVFDVQMAQAKGQIPAALRLPPELVERLQAAAAAEGEPEYQIMVRKWLEERLQQTRLAA